MYFIAICQKRTIDTYLLGYFNKKIIFYNTKHRSENQPMFYLFQSRI